MEHKLVRWNWIDYIKGICMLMVVMSHSSWPYWYARFFIPVFLTGFFFVSGYTFSRKKRLKDFLSSKVKSLIVPILCLGSINAVLATMAEGKPLLDRLCGLVIQRSGQWDDLWFVACLFTIEIIYYGITTLTESSTLRITICGILSVCGYFYIHQGGTALPWHFDNACVLVLFLGLGSWFRQWKFQEQLMAMIRMSNGWIWIFLAVGLYAILVVFNDCSLVDIHMRQYHTFGMFVFTAICGIIALIILTVRLERYSSYMISQCIRFIGQNTLVYYAFQFKAIRLIGLIGERLLSCSTYVGNILYCMLVCVVLAVPSYLINRYFPFLLGKSIDYKK